MRTHLFVVFLFMSPIVLAAPPLTIDLSQGSDIAPLIIHEEWSEFTLDSFLIKSWMTIDYRGFKFYNVSVYCNDYTIPFNKSRILWDFELYLDGILKERNSFVNFKDQNGTFRARLFCLPIPLNDTKIDMFMTYRVGKLSENFDPIFKPFLFPFDWYNFNFYRSRLDVPFIYSVKIKLPKSFEADYNNTSIIGDHRVDKVLVFVRNINGSLNLTPIANFTIYGDLIRPNLQSFEGDERVVIFPPTKLVSEKENLGERESLEAHLIIRRSSNEIYFFIIFVAGFLFIGAFYYSKKYRIEKMFELTMILWVAQEGLYQLSPTIRPISLTLFDLTFLIPPITFILLKIISKIRRTFTKSKQPNMEEKFILS